MAREPTLRRRSLSSFLLPHTRPTSVVGTVEVRVQEAHAGLYVTEDPDLPFCISGGPVVETLSVTGRTSHGTPLTDTLLVRRTRDESLSPGKRTPFLLSSRYPRAGRKDFPKPNLLLCPNKIIYTEIVVLI